MGTERDRVISISLSEAEWRAVVAQHPPPGTWIQDRIPEQLRAHPLDADAVSAPIGRDRPPPSRFPGSRPAPASSGAQPSSPPTPSARRLAGTEPPAQFSVRSSITTVARPGRLSPETRPPCRSIIALTIDSPSPLPLDRP